MKIKQFILTILTFLSLNVFGQNDSNFVEMYNVTFYDIAIKDKPSILGDVMYFVNIMESVYVDTSNTYNGYAPVIGGGWVSMQCINSEPVTEQEVSIMLENYLIKIGVKKDIEEPCAMSDYWKEKYEQTGNATDLDKFRMWFTKCLEKKY
jgi:hypothetical protein